MNDSTQKHWLETIFESPYFWGVLTLIAIAFGFSPRESGAGTWICLLFALATASAAVWFHPGVRSHSKRIGFTITGTVAGVILLFPLGFWLTRPKPEAAPGVASETNNPLEILAFRSDYGISIANNGPLPLYVTSLVIKGPDETKSFGLGLDIGPGKVSEAKIQNDIAFKNFKTLRKIADTWEGQVRKARGIYDKCGMSFEYFSPSDPSFKQVKDFYEGNGQSLGYGDISGMLYYHIRGQDKEEVVPIVVTIVVNKDTCPNL